MRFKKNTLSMSLLSAPLWRQKQVYGGVFLILIFQQGWASSAPNEWSVEAAHEADFRALALEAQHHQSQVESSVMAQEILTIAEQAKQVALQERAGQTTGIAVVETTKEELAKIQTTPINTDQLLNQIQAQNVIVVEKDPQGATITADGIDHTVAEIEKQGVFKRLWGKITGSTTEQPHETWHIKANVNVVRNHNVVDAQYDKAIVELKNNIEAKLSSFTQESFQDFEAAIPQLRILSNQAAQAIGFYKAQFYFKRAGDNLLDVTVIPNEPVLITSQNIDFRGEGANRAHFSVIKYLPDLEEGQIFHHGRYEQMKSRINDTATDNGYFDAYWRLHDVKVSQPQDTADINLWYDTGTRYKLGQAQFRMSDGSQKLPLNLDILESMVPWKQGADYAFWRVNGLANNLTNSRYFNYTLVNSIQPDPAEKKLELAPDIQKLIEEDRTTRSVILVQDKQRQVSGTEVTQTVVNEDQFAGTSASELKETRTLVKASQGEKELFEDLKLEAYNNKEIPVIVTLNADHLNSAELGLGYGTDTGTRLRSQYRRAIVNRHGHAFDANLELSRLRQSIDGRYSIPYHHPLNDYINIVGGYEREERKGVAPGMGLIIESAVLGADRVIKKQFSPWQRTFGLRYRLDRLTQTGTVDIEHIPDAFLANHSEEQESLLFGYEVMNTLSDRLVNPNRGFRQIYKLELGSENAFTDADLAIVNAGWRFIYSLGENYNHQFVGRADLGYIFTEDFSQVPYNLRYFTGGDQSIRGFDYKSLAAQENGFKVGGQALGVASLEYNYQFREGMRAAVFSDFGNAYDRDFSTNTAYGVGIGFRWASPIGSIRIDLASGLSDEGKPIRLHFFIGSPL